MVHLMARLLNLEASKPRSGADRVLRLLGLGEGEIVADIGAGGGYFAFLFSREVGTAGTVFAVETNSGSLDFIRKQAAKRVWRT